MVNILLKRNPQENFLTVCRDMVQVYMHPPGSRGEPSAGVSVSKWKSVWLIRCLIGHHHLLQPASSVASVSCFILYRNKGNNTRILFQDALCCFSPFTLICQLPLSYQDTLLNCQNGNWNYKLCETVQHRVENKCILSRMNIPMFFFPLFPNLYEALHPILMPAEGKMGEEEGWAQYLVGEWSATSTLLLL